MISVMVSLDLIDSEEERGDFYAVLAAKNWKKARDVDTVWFLTYSQLAQQTKESTEKVKVDIRSILLETAEKLKLTKIYYVAQIGNSEPIGRAIYKKNGVYTCFTRELY